MFEKLFKDALDKHITPALGIRMLIEEKLSNAGITVDRRYKKDLLRQIERLLVKNSSVFEINLYEGRLKKLNPDIDFSKLEDLSLDDDDFSRIADVVSKNVEDVAPQLIDAAAEKTWKILRKHRQEELAYARARRAEFEYRLEKRWRKGVDALEQLIGLAIDLGRESNGSGRAYALEHDDLVFEALIRLHARACRTASEVLTLIKAGFADGAHARWRSLHELAVVAAFVSEGGNDTANRYLLHEPIESFKAAREINRLHEEMGHEPISDAQIADLELRVTELKDHFGEAYGEQWGWASAALDNNPRPTFAQIEEFVGLQKWRPYFRMASHNVHAGPKGVAFSLGLVNDVNSTLLAGPSDTGFADPAHGTAISVFQITSLLLLRVPGLDSVIRSKVMLALVDEIGETFLRIQKKYEENYKKQVD